MVPLAPLEPHLAVAPDSVHFGTVVILTNVTRSLEVRNAGLGTLAVSSVTLVGAHAAEFAIESGGEAFSLASGDITYIVLRFSPRTVGNKSAALRLVCNDPDQETMDIYLTGVARPPPEPDVLLSAAALDFGGVLASSGTATHTLVVRNRGELPRSSSPI